MMEYVVALVPTIVRTFGDLVGDSPKREPCIAKA